MKIIYILFFDFCKVLREFVEFIVQMFLLDSYLLYYDFNKFIMNYIKYSFFDSWDLL